jgi:tetratricopeptide (TPR) repeat protein
MKKDNNNNKKYTIMKFKTLLVVALAASVPALACAKKPKKVAEEQVAEPAVVEEEPTITEECVMNVSLFHEAVKNKMYADAYGPWIEVYNTCPNANKSIYSDGTKIVEALYQATSDPAEKERLAKLAIEMQDKRIKYFGNDPKYPKAYILGEKGLAYVDFYGEGKLSEARECLRQSVEGMGNSSKIMVLVKLVDVSYALYKQDPNGKAEQFISDYELASNALAEQAGNTNNKNAEIAGKQKDYVDNIFAVSGAADCSKLDEIYAAAVKENLQNLDMLTKIAKLYKRVRCTESDVYFAACEAAHKLQPTDESAAGCASMAAKKGDYEQAVAYYDQAIKLAMVEDELEDVADYQYNAAFYCYNNLKKYAEARKYALASIATLQGLGMNKGQGRCYIIIGMCYASTQLYPQDAKGRILNKTVYWAAVDKFVKAKQIDPSVEAQASEFISSYSKYYPTKEERFDLPNEFSGSTYYVGGWIGETTSIR